MEKIKTFLLISLSVVVFALFYMILSGVFCHCSNLTCPSDDELRSYFT